MWACGCVYPFGCTDVCKGERGVVRIFCACVCSPGPLSPSQRAGLLGKQTCNDKKFVNAAAAEADENYGDRYAAILCVSVYACVVMCCTFYSVPLFQQLLCFSNNPSTHNVHT